MFKIKMYWICGERSSVTVSVKVYNSCVAVHSSSLLHIQRLTDRV